MTDVAAAKRTFSATDLKECAETLTARMKEESYEALYYNCLVKMQGPPQPHILLQAMELLQCEALIDLGYRDGGDALKDLKQAVRRFPQDEELRKAIVGLCEIEENLMRKVQYRRCEEMGIKMMTQEQQMEMQKKQMAHMKMMEEAVGTFPKERQQRMTDISNKMRAGQTPTPEEQAYAMECRKMIDAYIATMQEMMADMAAAE